MLPRSVLLRCGAAIAALVMLSAGLVVGFVATADARPTTDPRRTQGLFVDPYMPAAQRGGVYADMIGRVPQAFWVIPEAYPTTSVRAKVREYTTRAGDAHKTPMLVIYGIPGRDCGWASSDGALKSEPEYRAWVRQIADGLRGERAIVVVEPDALPFFSSPAVNCSTRPTKWPGMLRFAVKKLAKSGAWVYLDAGHSNWTPYGSRADELKAAGVRFARGISTNVSNFRPTADEKKYATTLIRKLGTLGVKGKKYIVDTSRNGATPSSDGNDVCNPPWARVGARPRLVFKGPFDGTLWIKHPGESDGADQSGQNCHGGPPSGTWSDQLADGLLG